MGTLCSKRDIYNIEKESDERNQVNMIDYKESDEKDQIDENGEEILNTDTEFLKLIKFSSQKYIDNVKKESNIVLDITSFNFFSIDKLK